MRNSQGRMIQCTWSALAVKSLNLFFPLFVLHFSSPFPYPPLKRPMSEFLHTFQLLFEQTDAWGDWVYTSEVYSRLHTGPLPCPKARIKEFIISRIRWQTWPEGRKGVDGSSQHYGATVFRGFCRRTSPLFSLATAGGAEAGAEANTATMTASAIKTLDAAHLHPLPVPPAPAPAPAPPPLPPPTRSSTHSAASARLCDRRVLAALRAKLPGHELRDCHGCTDAEWLAIVKDVASCWRKRDGGLDWGYIQLCFRDSVIVFSKDADGVLDAAATFVAVSARPADWFPNDWVGIEDFLGTTIIGQATALYLASVFTRASGRGRALVAAFSEAVRSLDSAVRYVILDPVIEDMALRRLYVEGWGFGTLTEKYLFREIGYASSTSVASSASAGLAAAVAWAPDSTGTSDATAPAAAFCSDSVSDSSVSGSGTDNVTCFDDAVCGGSSSSSSNSSSSAAHIRIRIRIRSRYYDEDVFLDRGSAALCWLNSHFKASGSNKRTRAMSTL
jgi:hypothetical protein